MSRAQGYPGMIYRYFMHDSLRRNSSLLIASQTVNAGAAFVFWIVCARIFKTSEVGLAAAIVSFGALISTFTNLGLPNTVLRFLPTSKRPGGLLTGSMYLSVLASTVGALVSIIVIKYFVPKLAVVPSEVVLSLLVVLLIVGNTLSALFDSVLLSYRKGEFILWRALIVNIPRIALPFFVVDFGLRGIIGTYVIMLTVGIVYGLAVILRVLLKHESLVPHLDEVLRHRKYSGANYFGGNARDPSRHDFADHGPRRTRSQGCCVLLHADADSSFSELHS